jgi:hypothetical protein
MSIFEGTRGMVLASPLESIQIGQLRGVSAMTTFLESHCLPQLAVRGPDTTGPLDDVPSIRKFRDALLKPSGVSQPTTLVIDLEGRFPSVTVLVELIIPLAQIAKSGSRGPLTLIVCTQDESVRTVIRALAESQDLPIYLASSSRHLHGAQPAGSLTATEHETLDILNNLGGRTTISTFAEAAGLESNTATNRLMNVHSKGFVQRIERPRRHGQLFLDPRVARPTEEAANPTTGDRDIPEPVRRDIRSLTEMQIVEPGEDIPNAWNELLTANSEYWTAEQEKMARMTRDNDLEGLEKIIAQGYSKRHSQTQNDEEHN